MKVILTQDVKKVGKKGELITVADGFGLNALIKTGKGIVATAENIKKYTASVAHKELEHKAEAERARALLAQVDGTRVTVPVQASVAGTLFKAIHEADIAAAIKRELGVSLPHPAIVLPHPIKQKGVHSVDLVLNGAQATIEVTV